MATRSHIRESRSVRLHNEEWDLAEAIAHMSGERSQSAGYGLREALRVTADRLRRQGRGGELDSLLEEARTGREQRAGTSR